ncbi:putative nuclease HARBI1 [Prorops nasuta]|uniref:putative nuclease HARBI1 n=1 Tax=Prorops nasuta TaxID=863751 RepID=UPI0034CDE99C
MIRRLPQDVITTFSDQKSVTRRPKALIKNDMIRSGDEAEVFRNRKGLFTLNVQAICDAEMKFLDLVVRWPGSTHDSTIFNASRIHAKFINNEIKDCFLVGDSGYACTNFMMTPLLRTNNRSEELYNESQIRTRNVIERTFGVWKRRFPILVTGMRLKLSTIQGVIVATGILHNIALKMNDPEPLINDEIQLLLDEENDNTYNIVHTHTEQSNVRRTLIATYFSGLIR